jgi:hypothetical protein
LSSATSRFWGRLLPRRRRKDSHERSPSTSDANPAEPTGGVESNRNGVNVEDGGVDVEDVVRQVKQAIIEAHLSGPDDDLEVTAVNLQLSDVSVRGGGVDAKLQIPVINKDVGGGWETKWTSTNTVEISLKPPKIAGVAQILRKADITSDLGRAIVLVRSAVRAGASGQPSFELGGATVELAFGVSNDGSITFLAKGEAGKTSTNTLKLTLAPKVKTHSEAQAQSGLSNKEFEGCSLRAY